MKENWFFLRGLIRESEHWRDFLAAFASAFPARRVIAMDLPGTGELRHLKSPLSISSTARLLREKFSPPPGESNYLFAISLGAMVGFEWMAEFPDDFKGAVLLNTSLRGLSPLWHRLRPENYLTLLRLFGPCSHLEREKTILRITSSGEHPALAETWAKLAEERPVTKANAIRQLIAAARFSPPKERPRPRVLLLNSLGDRLVSPDCSRRIAEHWQLPLHTHPKAGHDLTLDAPEWVLEQLRSI